MPFFLKERYIWWQTDVPVPVRTPQLFKHWSRTVDKPAIFVITPPPPRSVHVIYLRPLIIYSQRKPCVCYMFLQLMFVKQHFNNTHLKLLRCYLYWILMLAFISPVFDNSTVLKSGKHFSLGYLSKVLGFCRHNRIQAAAARGHCCYRSFSFEDAVINRSSFTSHLPPTRTHAHRYPAGQANPAAGVRTILLGGLWSWSCAVRFRKRRGGGVDGCSRMCLLEKSIKDGLS